MREGYMSNYFYHSVCKAVNLHETFDGGPILLPLAGHKCEVIDVSTEPRVFFPALLREIFPNRLKISLEHS